jgi:hypothetical protein
MYQISEPTIKETRVCKEESPGFRRDVDDIRAALEYYTALSVSSIPTFRDNPMLHAAYVYKRLTP